MKKNQLKIILGITCAIIGLAGCSKKPTTNQQPTTTVVENPVVEEPETKVEEPEPTVEEPAVEEPEPEVEEPVEDSDELIVVDTSNLPEEAWLESLDADVPVVLIINDITGKRCILNTGAHYTLVEGDNFIIFYTEEEGWKAKEQSNLIPYVTGFNETKKISNCTVFGLNYSEIPDDFEVIVHSNNIYTDEEAITNVYITVDPSLK